MSQLAQPVQTRTTHIAPLACLDEGFSSDGAFVSGVETEPEQTPTEDSPPTPTFQLPGMQKPGILAPEEVDDSGMEQKASISDQETPSDSLNAPADVKPDTPPDKQTLLSHGNSMEESEPTSPCVENVQVVPNIDVDMKRPPTLAMTPKTMTGENRRQSEKVFTTLRKQYETQAVTRRRSTTPIQSCAIEEYIEEYGKRTRNTSSNETDERLEIKLHDDIVTVRPTERRMSRSWAEFQETMSQSQSRCASGRSSPQSCLADTDIPDMLDHNFADKVPPSPVVHRRTSQDWVMFEEGKLAKREKGAERLPPQSKSAKMHAQMSGFAPVMTQDDYDKISSYRTESEQTYQLELQENCEKTIEAQVMSKPQLDSKDAKSKAQTTKPQKVETTMVESQHENPIMESQTVDVPKTESQTADVSKMESQTVDVRKVDKPQKTSSALSTLEKLKRLNPPTKAPPPPPPRSGFIALPKPKKMPPPEPPQLSPEDEYNEAPLYDYPSNHTSTLIYEGSLPSTVYIEGAEGYQGYEDPIQLPSTVYVEGAEGYQSYDPNQYNYYGQAYVEPDDAEVPQVMEDTTEDFPVDSGYQDDSRLGTTNYTGVMTKYASSLASDMKDSGLNSDPMASYLSSWDAEPDKRVPPERPVSPAPKRPMSPMPARPPPPTSKKEPEKVEPEPEPEDDWRTHLAKLTEKVDTVVKETEEKITEMQSATVIKLMKPYSGKIRRRRTSDDADAEEEPQQPEWKDIDVVLNEQIKKKKEAMKPRRPPPPPVAPIEPPKPKPSIVDMYSNWDESTAAVLASVPTYEQPKIEEEDDPSQREASIDTPEDSKDEASGDLDESEDYPMSPATPDWTPIEAVELPASESDFFARLKEPMEIGVTTDSKPDPFAPLIEDSVIDPFQVKNVDDIVAEAKATAETQVFFIPNWIIIGLTALIKMGAEEAQNDLKFFGMGSVGTSRQVSTYSQSESETEDPEADHDGFADNFDAKPFVKSDQYQIDPSIPLFDEDDTTPLPEFTPRFDGPGWELMLRYPIKKKIMGERYWKQIYIKIEKGCIMLYHSKNDKRPFQELPIEEKYCLSNVELNQYDIYGKIHVVKLQHVVYKERVGLRPGQIPKFAEGNLARMGLPLEHAAVSTQLLKFGSLSHEYLSSFVHAIENLLFELVAFREKPLIPYKQDEIQVHVHDEYCAQIDKDGHVVEHKGRVRVFCLTFLSGMPYLEIGLNNTLRQNKESSVRKKDIMPMYTEKWIKMEQLQFHRIVDKKAHTKDKSIKMQPLDACYFEICRFRIRPARNRELPLSVKSCMRIAGSKIEIRLEAMVTGFKTRKIRQPPCEDIQIRFPIPEAWIYLFREERHWGYGSVHAQKRRPGKTKNIKDRVFGIVQHVENSLMEVAAGDAKYEHVYRSIVWRIPKLPEKHHGAYKTHLLLCRFQLSSFDLMPETFLPNCEVEYTMPITTVSNTVVRSISLSQYETPDEVEKWVRYVAKYQYKNEIDYVQVSEIDIEDVYDPKNIDPAKVLDDGPQDHQTGLDFNVSKDTHEGYRITNPKLDFTEEEMGMKVVASKSPDSSPEEEEIQKPFPVVKIDMTGFNDGN